MKINHFLELFSSSIVEIKEKMKEELILASIESIFVLFFPFDLDRQNKKMKRKKNL